MLCFAEDSEDNLHHFSGPGSSNFSMASTRLRAELLLSPFGPGSFPDNV